MRRKKRSRLPYLSRWVTVVLLFTYQMRNYNLTKQDSDLTRLYRKLPETILFRSRQ